MDKNMVLCREKRLIKVEQLSSGKAWSVQNSAVCGER